MEFREFADRTSGIEAADADTAIVALTEALLGDAGADLPVVARFVQGRVFPAWSSRTLDVGPSLCYEAIARAAGTNVDADEVEERLAEVGEIGEVAASFDLGGQAGLAAFGGGTDGGAEDLTVGEVADELDALAAAAGSGSQDRKLDLLFGLFNRCSPPEARYLARIVLGEMRIGVGEGSVRDATAAAFEVPVGAVARALQVTNDYGQVAESAREAGVEGLDELRLEVGRPVQAMLAQAGSVTDALEEWGEAVVETKYDGARVQVHYDGDEVQLFSRNMEEVTDPLPEIVETVEDAVEPPAILDGEVVAVDDGDPLPFQEVLRRFRRKHDVEAAREDVATELHVFDCLHAPAEVHQELEPTLPASLERDPPAEDESDDEASSDANATLAKWTDDANEGTDGGANEGTDCGASGDTDGGANGDGDHGSDAGDESDASATVDPDEPALPELDDPDADGVDLLRAPLRLRREYLAATAEEGVVVDATVSDDPEAIEAVDAAALEAGHEGIMLKDPDSTYSPGRRGKEWLKRKPDVETLDLVVTGAEWGEGRRATFLGTFLLSARMDDGFVEVGKVATGITDEGLAELTERLEPHVRAEDGQTVEIEPAVVFEVGYEEIQRSPTYESGYALRFPRFVAVRTDVDPADADSLERIERLAGE